MKPFYNISLHIHKRKCIDHKNHSLFKMFISEEANIVCLMRIRYHSWLQTIHPLFLLRGKMFYEPSYNGNLVNSTKYFSSILWNYWGYINSTGFVKRYIFKYLHNQMIGIEMWPEHKNQFRINLYQCRPYKIMQWQFLSSVVERIRI